MIEIVSIGLDWYRYGMMGYSAGRVLGHWIGFSSFDCGPLVD